MEDPVVPELHLQFFPSYAFFFPFPWIILLLAQLEPITGKFQLTTPSHMCENKTLPLSPIESARIS